MQYVLSSVNICSNFLSHLNYIKISTYDIYVQEAPIETDFMGRFYGSWARLYSATIDCWKYTSCFQSAY